MATELKIGDKAPAFKAKNESNELVSLTQYKGKKLVLYFYPKDDTPGCTSEACDLRDNYQTFIAKGYEILGVSPDTATKHQKFIAKYELPFSLLADEDNAEATDSVKQRVLSAWVKLMMMEHGGMVEAMPADNRSDLSFLIAQAIPDVQFRQQILSMRSEKERMDSLSSFLPSYLEREKLTRHVRRVAPLNGHAKHAPEVAET